MGEKKNCKYCLHKKVCKLQFTIKDLAYSLSSLNDEDLLGKVEDKLHYSVANICSEYKYETQLN